MRGLAMLDSGKSLAGAAFEDAPEELLLESITWISRQK